MAKQEHVDILKKGLESWWQWRKKYPDLQPDLSCFGVDSSDRDGVCFCRQHSSNTADFEGVNLSNARLSGLHMGGADLSGAILINADLRYVWGKVDFDEAIMTNAVLTRGKLSESSYIRSVLNECDFTEAELRQADFYEAFLVKANLKDATLIEANFRGADLTGANLSGADLSGANFTKANLTGADLTGADLTKAIFVETTLNGAILTNCLVYGLSAWGITVNQDTIQSNLRITSNDEPSILVDNLEVAQFIYLILNNKKLKEVIDSATSKIVLILGRFTPERKRFLDFIANEFRKRNLIPVIFDFDKPDSRSKTDTIKILASLSRYIIVDLTDGTSAPWELGNVISVISNMKIPIQPLLAVEYDHKGEFKREFSMADDLFDIDYCLDLKKYESDNPQNMTKFLDEHVIPYLEAKRIELMRR